MRTFLATASAAGVLLLTLVPAGAEAAGSQTQAPGTKAVTRMLTPQQLASGVDKTVVIDTKTGAITESWLGIPESSTMISTRNPCTTNDGCYVTGRIPYANVGFYGSPGTKTGSWPYRSQIASGQYTVKGCWASACSPRLSPRTQAFLSPMVTGTSFTIYS